MQLKTCQFTPSFQSSQKVIGKLFQVNLLLERQRQSKVFFFACFVRLLFACAPRINFLVHFIECICVRGARSGMSLPACLLAFDAWHIVASERLFFCNFVLIMPLRKLCLTAPPKRFSGVMAFAQYALILFAFVGQAPKINDRFEGRAGNG